MNIYLLQVLTKWISLFVVSLMSFFGLINIDSKQVTIENKNQTKNYNVVNEVIKYSTITNYDSRLPSGKEKVIKEGINGLKYVDPETNKTIILKKATDKIIEVGTGSYGEFVGRITGYGPDCYGCSKTGTVACRTLNGKSHSLIKNGIYYNDSEFGKVRILAASISGFPCGTIITVSKGKTNFKGVVLDTGYSMRQAWQNGNVWIDLAYASQKDARTKGIITGKNINYSVERWGW